jgi:hypothetical protein
MSYVDCRSVEKSMFDAYGPEAALADVIRPPACRTSTRSCPDLLAKIEPKLLGEMTVTSAP